MRTTKAGQKKTALYVGDVISVAGVLLLSFFVWFLFFLVSNGSGVRVIVVEGGSKIVAEYDIGRDCVYDVVSSNGHKLMVTVNDGSVSVSESTCNNRHCIAMGKIRNSRETLVCVPAKIKIKIVSRGEDMQNDFIVG